MIRCFIGLPLPEEYRTLVRGLRGEWQKKLASRMSASHISWTRPENWHLTLKFLGNVDEGKIPPLCRALDSIPFERFFLQGGDGGFFPQKGAPRVAWVGLAQGGGECAELASRVDEACAGLGFEPESRPFRPHLTVARIRRAERDPWDEFAASLGRVQWPQVTMDAMVLWQSVLSPQGPSYTPLHVVKGS